MADLWRDFWVRVTGTGQQVAQLHDRYMMMIIIIIIIICIIVSCHRPFLPGTSLESAVIPIARASTFTLQYFPYYVWCSKYSCLCSESIECFPGTAYKFFLKLLVTIPVAPIIIGIIVHFRFHIPCISIHKLFHLGFFSAPFVGHFCLQVLPRLSEYMFSLFGF